MKTSSIIGDITQQKVDAVVNAANRELAGGSGVNGAIHKAGGPEIYRFCEDLRAKKYQDGLPAGQSAITPGGKLTAKWIIHTVGPQYGQHHGKEAELLVYAGGYDEKIREEAKRRDVYRDFLLGEKTLRQLLESFSESDRGRKIKTGRGFRIDLRPAKVSFR